MEHTLWKTMVVCCLAANFGAGSLFARGGGIGGGGGGGTAHVGGGAPHVGGGGAPHAGGGGTPHAGGGGGSPQLGGGSAPVHSSNGLQAAGASVSHLGGQQSLNHVPGGGQQNLGAQNLNLSNHTVISGSPQVGHHPGMNGTSTSGVGVSNQLGQAGHVGQNSQIHLGQSNLNGQTHLGNGLNSGVHGVNAGKVSEFHNSGISHQQFVGNTVNFGNRQINLGGAGYRPAYCRHEQFYHGHWNGNYGFPGYGHYGGYGWGGPGFGYGMYGYRPFFWGLGGWGLGSLVYGSGYVGYYNPYYYNTNAFSYGYNYAQPIPVVYNATNPAYSMNTGSVTDPNAVVTNSSDAVMNSAVAAFRQNDYDGAIGILNQGITQTPDDAVLHEFRALVLFAKGEYQPAAATVHSILAVGPGWDWTTLSGLYADIGLYTVQLRALEAYVKQNPQDGASRFLLAYHYTSDGYPDAAAKQLQQVVTLVPNDQVAASLLKMASVNQTSSLDATVAQPSPQPPVDLPPTGSQAPATPIDPSAIIGAWKASRDDGSSFALSLNEDKTFSWGFMPKQQPAQSFNGTYSLDGNVVALERTGGGSLVAAITFNAASEFNFKMVGSPSEDPGLNFTK